jgi:hypothetical protein
VCFHCHIDVAAIRKWDAFRRCPHRALQASRTGGIEIGRPMPVDRVRWIAFAPLQPKKGAPDVRRERRPVRLVGRTSRCKNNVFPNPERRGPRVIPNLRRSSALSRGPHCCTRASRLTPNRVARERGAKVADTEFIPARWQRGWLGARINHWRRRIWDDARAKIVARGAVEG